jgi:PKD repeat protein
MQDWKKTTAGQKRRQLLRPVVLGAEKLEERLVMSNSPIGSAQLLATMQGLPPSGSSPEGSAVNLRAVVSGATGNVHYAWMVLKAQQQYATSKTSALSFTPNDDAAYQITLTVTDVKHSVSTSQMLYVSDVAPTVSVAAGFSGGAGSPIQLTASATSPSAVDMANGFNYVWQFGDGTTGTGQTVSHVYAAAGNYSATVTVTDKDGGAPAAASTSVAFGSSLTASIAGLPATGQTKAGTPLNLAAQVSGGVGADSYSWAVILPSGQKVASGSGASLAFTPDVGNYQVSLTVTDSAGHAATATNPLVVADVPPTVTLTDPPAQAGQPAAFAASATDPSPSATAAGFGYSWNFGDGTTAAGAGVSHTFAAAGTYNVTVTATDIYGGVGFASTSVTVFAPLQASISGLPSSGQMNVGTALTLGAQASGGVGADSYQWAVTANGQTLASGSTASLNFTPDVGTYQVSLTATDSAGHTATSAQALVVADVPPTVTLIDPAVQVGQPISFSASASNPSPSATAAGFMYSWNFGDGTTAAGAGVSHTYAVVGNYTVTVTATDKYGGVGFASTSVTVFPPLQASITGLPSSGQSSAETPLTVSAQASGGFGADSYRWVVTSNGQTVASGNTGSLSFTPDVGTYQVSLTATDSMGDTATAVKSLTVSDVPPTASLSGPTAGQTGQALNFAASATDLSPSATAAGFVYSWNFGDGTAAAGAGVSHTYSAAGKYNVIVMATDTYGGSGSATSSVTVTAPQVSVPVTVSISGPSTYQVGQTPSYTAGATEPASGGTAPAFSYAWTWGDGASTTGSPTQHGYAAPGTYSLNVTATDQFGNSGTASQQINVTPIAAPLQATLNGVPASGHSPAGTPVTLTAQVTGGMGITGEFWSVTKNGATFASGTWGTINFTPDTATTYQVTFLVTDTSGAASRASATLIADAVAPMSVSIGGPSTYQVGQMPYYTAVATESSSVNPAPAFSYAWTWGDGASTTGSPTQHGYAAPGTYTMNVTATDQFGNSATASTSLTIAQATSPPPASPPPATSPSSALQASIAGLPSSGHAGEGAVVVVTAQASGGSGTLTYAWSVTKNGQAFATGSGASFGFTPDDNATYQIGLAVTDGTGATGAGGATLVVDNVPPTPYISGPSIAQSGQALTFLASASDPSTVDTLAGFTYSWNFGDGGTGSGVKVSHAYASPGTYTVTLTATDKDGGVGTFTSAVAVFSASAFNAPNEPLLYNYNVQYVGAFRVPNYYNRTDEMSFGGAGLAYNPANNSLFISGHYNSLAEISIPQSVVNSSNLNALATASVLQPWTNVLGRLPNPLTGAADGAPIGGLLVANGELIGTEYAYYTGAYTQTTSHFVLDSLNLATANVGGLYQLGDQARLEAGYMAPIPQEWQPALGAPDLTGQADIPIVTATSSGPAAFGFDPRQLGAGVAPATPYLYYPSDTPLGAYTGPANPLQSGTASVNGAVFVPGSSSVLFFGKTGTNYEGYGEPASYGDGLDGGKGPHSLNGEYSFQVWAYDAHDFVAVKNGTMQPWQVQPYDVWNFKLPIPGYEVGGVAFDPSSGRIYVTETNVDGQAPGSWLPLIQVFQVNLNPPGIAGPIAPQIGSLAATPSTLLPGPIPAGTLVNLTAGNVYAISPGANVKQVVFYLDTNNNGALDTGTDQVLGYGTSSAAPNAEHNWATTFSTAGMASGTYTVFAQALDSNGLFSSASAGTLTIA